MGATYMGGGYYGGGMAGGSMGGDPGSEGLLGGIQALLSTLPPWLALIITAVGLLLAAAFVGWLVGQIVGRILYPNPEKKSLLSKTQKFVCLGALLVSFGIILYALKPVDPSVSSDGDMMTSGQNVSGSNVQGGEVPEDGLSDGEAPEPEEDAPPAASQAQSPDQVVDQVLPGAVTADKVA